MIHLQDGPHQATVDQRGATLLNFRVKGTAVLHGPGAVVPELGHHGAVLAPWPNRVEQGRYEHGGRTYQLPCNDVANGHALHGVVFDRDWLVDDRADDAVTLSVRIADEPGYPFDIHLTVRYSILEGALRCEAYWRNLGRRTAPFGIGFHPYLVPGPSPMDDWILEIDAGEVFIPKHGGLIPTSRVPVASTELDFRHPQRIGRRAFSAGFGDLGRREGYGVTRLRDPVGYMLELRMSDSLPWVQVFTGDLPSPDLRRRGLAVEPQSCPANAFVNGIDLMHLRPGEHGNADWSITAWDAPADGAFAVRSGVGY